MLTNTFSYRFGGFQSKIQIHSGGAFEPAFFDRRRGVLFIFDSNTHALFGKDLPRAVIIPTGEKNKSWKSVEAIHDAALKADLSRDGTMIGVGGGIVCDIAAFAASVYMRGCRLVLVPTSLLAMVDASVGGKTGINFRGFKNMIGTFYPAEEILMYTDMLQTLDERQYGGSLAEVIKTSLLGDSELYEILSSKSEGILARDRAVLSDVIRRCVAVKGKIVEDDLRESGSRAHLNLGHTFAHALEAVTRFENWTHGEAVAWGIAKALALGVKIGITESSYAEEVLGLLRKYGFRTSANGIEAALIVQAMQRDKKRKEGKLRFVLQRRIHTTIVEEIDEADLLGIIN